MNKTQAVYEHLLTGASITLKESVAMFNLYALSQTLGKLRREKGVPIQSVTEVKNGAKYGRYWLDKSYIEQVRAGKIKPLGS